MPAVILAAALSLSPRAWGQADGSVNALTVCSSPKGPEAGPIVTISYSTAPSSLSAVVLSPRRGNAPGTRRQQRVRRYGSGRGKARAEVAFEGDSFELLVDTSKPARPRLPAKLRTMSAFGVRAAKLSCLQFDFDGDEETCVSQGGTWSSQPPSCVWDSLDGGKPCRDSSQCETACVAPDSTPEGKHVKGHCFGKTSLQDACVSIVSGGTAGRAVCTD